MLYSRQLWKTEGRSEEISISFSTDPRIILYMDMTFGEKNIDKIIINSLKRVGGILNAVKFNDKHRESYRDVEKKAEEAGLMGLGRVVNTGIRDVLKCNCVYTALTNMSFDWGCHPSLILTKDNKVVGEEVRDKVLREKLEERDDVWFLHDQFVIYKDRMVFPSDITKRICQFETPSIPAEWCIVEDEEFESRSIIYANPSVPGDLFLKEVYFNRAEEKGYGTILVGVDF